MQIKKDDMVVVIAGKDKGKTGQVLRTIPKKNKVVVEGVNMQTQPDFPFPQALPCALFSTSNTFP